MIAIHPNVLQSIQHTGLAAHGALAVAMCHLQLAMNRLNRKSDRVTRDHIETALVFMDSAQTVVATINEIAHRAEQNDDGVKLIGSAG